MIYEKFIDYRQGYLKLDTLNVDWIMKNIMNVTSGYSYLSDDSYCDGYYYFSFVQGKDVTIEPSIIIK